MERIQGRLGGLQRVISYDKLKWPVFSFQTYKSPGTDGIIPIMLQQVFELLAGKLTEQPYSHLPIEVK
jgi:hypothetical protein